MTAASGHQRKLPTPHPILHFKLMRAIHVIFKKQRPKEAAGIEKCADAADEWTSGRWVIREQTAKAFVGHHLYFHNTQAKPSFFGGVILNVTKIPEGEFAGRVVFRFKYDASFRGVITSREGWGQEMKIVWD